MKKILIIGNGFDRAHGLPTTYSDFLNMCASVVHYYSSVYHESPPSFRKWSSLEKAREFQNRIDPETFDKLREALDDNFWVEEFMERRELLGGYWLNFETEIERVVYSLVNDAKQVSNEIVKKVSDRVLNSYAHSKGFYHEKTYGDLFKYLLQEYNRLISALEIYMDAYINKMDKEPQLPFSSHKFDYLLSFNYTNTYTETYGIPEEWCYIHGRADLAKKQANMILGFDDHYVPLAQVVPEAIPFEKYYQRIVKRTDNNYLSWIETGNDDADETMHVTIYGHSLAPSDGDVIKAFVSAKNASTEIYYLDEEDRADKVKNLAIILGPNELIKLAGGTKPRITFVKI